MRSEREIARDLGGMRHFKKINWRLVRDLEHHDDREDKTLSRFEHVVGILSGESRTSGNLFAHYNTIRCLTRNRITTVSNAKNLILVFSCLRLLRSFLRKLSIRRVRRRRRRRRRRRQKNEQAIA